jgi:hypothetical protein
LRWPFQWNPSFFKLARISRTGGTLNSSQTHLPTTWASPQISGISVFNVSSRASVLLAVLADMVSPFLASARACGLLLLVVLSPEA